jgi:predicted MFS family arabinose efflux permease
MSGQGNLVAAAFALTALTYGLARFAYGLMLPDIRVELDLDAATAGWIGGSAFAAYCLGIGASLVAGRRFGPRPLTVVAGLLATAGLALAGLASSGTSLALAIALGGLSTGLTSPPLATAVAHALPEAARPRANGAINAGTAAGIILSGLAVLLFAGSWRGLYLVFATLGVLTSLWLWRAIPGGRPPAPTQVASGKTLLRRGLVPLGIAALLAGAASTAVWTFGADILRGDARLDDRGIAIAWIALGLGGVAGMGTGGLAGRFGLPLVHRWAVAGMAIAVAGLALAGEVPALAFPVMAGFGLAYIVSSGVFLLWGIQLYADRPALGLGLPFLLLAIGQSAGAPLFGTLLDLLGVATTLGGFALLMSAALFWAPPPEVKRLHPAAAV